MPETEAHDEHDGEFVCRMKQEPREALRIVPNLQSQGNSIGEIRLKALRDPWDSHHSKEKEETKKIKDNMANIKEIFRI